MKNRFYRFLRWSERYTGTDMVYLFKGGSWLTFGQIFTAGSVLLTSIAFANLLPQEIYGIYKYAISIFGILAITTLSGLNTAVAKAVARGFDGDIKKALKTRIRWGLAGAILSFLIAGYYYFQDNNILALTFIIVGCFTPFLNPLSIYGSVLQGKKNFKIYSIYNTISKILEAVAIIITLFFTKNIFILLLVFFASNTVLNGIFCLITFSKEKLNELREKDTLSYGKHLSAITVINFIAGQLDKVLVFQFIGAIELAIYAFATAPIDQMKGLFKNINLLAFPKIAGAEKTILKKYILNKLVRFGIGVSIVAVAYIILAPYFFRFFFPTYTDSIFYSQILAPSILFASIASFLDTSLNALGAKRQIIQFQTYSNITSLILLFFFIYYWGLLGVILSRLIARFLIMLLSIFLIRKV